MDRLHSVEICKVIDLSDRLNSYVNTVCWYTVRNMCTF